MGVIEDKINELKKREAAVRQMGGEKAVSAQHAKGKLTARERLDPAGVFRGDVPEEVDVFPTELLVKPW